MPPKNKTDTAKAPKNKTAPRARPKKTTTPEIESDENSAREGLDEPTDDESMEPRSERSTKAAGKERATAKVEEKPVAKKNSTGKKTPGGDEKNRNGDDDEPPKAKGKEKEMTPPREIDGIGSGLRNKIYQASEYHSIRRGHTNTGKHSAFMELYVRGERRKKESDSLEILVAGKPIWINAKVAKKGH